MDSNPEQQSVDASSSVRKFPLASQRPISEEPPTTSDWIRPSTHLPRAASSALGPELPVNSTPDRHRSTAACPNSSEYPPPLFRTRDHEAAVENPVEYASPLVGRKWWESGLDKDSKPSVSLEEQISRNSTYDEELMRQSRRFGGFGMMYGSAPYFESTEEKEQDTDGDDSHSYPKGWTRAALLTCALVPYSMASLDDTIIATLVPVLIDAFKQPEDIGWYASAEYLPYAVLMPSLGKAYNLWKIKWLFLGSIVIFMVGSITCASSQSSLIFILGRGITGSGGAGILQGAMRINEITFPRRQRMYVEAAGIAVMGACIMSGPLVGGLIADTLGWEWAFWINLPTSAVSFIGTLFLFPKEAPRSPLNKLPTVEKIMQLDPIGTSLLVASICCLITLLQNYSASLTLLISNTDILLAVISGALFVLFLLQEYYVRPDLALIPRAILRRRAVWANCLVLFFLFMGFTNFVFFLSIFLQVVQGDSPGQSAINLLPYVVSATVASGLIAFVVPRARYYNPFFLVGGVLFITGMGLVSRIDQNITFTQNAGLQVLIGIGVGILVLANVAPCHIELPERDHAIANGLAFFASSLGSTISIPASSALFNHQIIQGFKNLDVPLVLKVQILKDITNLRRILPPESLNSALDIMVRAINLTFIIGLITSIICGVSIFFIPWKAVIRGPKVPAGSGKQLIPKYLNGGS